MARLHRAIRGLLLAAILAPASGRQDQIRRRAVGGGSAAKHNERLSTLGLDAQRPVGTPADQRAEHPRQQGKIVGGDNATLGEFPYFTLLLRLDGAGGYRHGGCGGTLISSCYVLTAAHCVNKDRTGILVYVNAYNPYEVSLGSPFHVSTVTEVLVHEDFEEYTLQNDVALLKLDQCADTTDFPPVELAPPDFPIGEVLQVVGLGWLKEEDEDRVQVSTLQKAFIPFVNESTCANDYSESLFNVYAGMICAGSGTIDACFGDSGGPLLQYGLNSSSTTHQVGIVSWGEGCARVDRPGVYTSVPVFHDWISRRVCSDTATDQSISLCAAVVPGRDTTNGGDSIPVDADRCRNTGGLFNMLVPVRRGRQYRKYKCDDMAPGGVAHKYCYFFIPSRDSLAIDMCPQSCNPECFMSDGAPP